MINHKYVHLNLLVSHHSRIPAIVLEHVVARPEQDAVITNIQGTIVNIVDTWNAQARIKKIINGIPGRLDETWIEEILENIFIILIYLFLPHVLK